jgi:hypothetical protein
MNSKRFEAKVTRYVVTHISNGHRRLTFAMQGQDTYATEDEAQAKLRTMVEGEINKVLTEDEIKTMAVRPCDCWPNGYDPKGMWFESTLGWIESFLTTTAGLPDNDWKGV